MFNYVPCPEFGEAVREDRPNGRVYVTPEGKVYPSVTTVLGYGDNEWLEEWKKKVGPEEAALTSARAAARGTRMHTLLETALMNKPVNPGLFDREMFQCFKKALPRINNIRCFEKRLHSDILKVAGTVDLIAEWDGKLAIIDWKTSGRVKTAEDIPDYFMQCGAYALAFEERTGIKVPDIVIVMGVDHEREPLIFVEKAKHWIPPFIVKRKNFRQGMGF